jgi:hypothetical protein
VSLADLSKIAGDHRLGEELDTAANPLGLRPDPAQFVRFLRTVGRDDVSSDLFVRLLESYRELKSDADADPMRYVNPT